MLDLTNVAINKSQTKYADLWKLETKIYFLENQAKYYKLSQALVSSFLAHVLEEHSSNLPELSNCKNIVYESLFFRERT